MTLKEGTTLTPSTTKPHQLTAVGATHDDNGNRSAKTNQTYTYNGDDRLTQVTVSGAGNVSFVYDYSGRQVARVAGSSIIRYFSELAESSSDGYLTKHYFAAGLRIASRRAYAPLLAGLPPDPAIQVAQGSPGQAALVLVLRADVQRGVLLSVIVLGTGLLVAPWRRKRVVGIALRHGHVIGVVIVLSVATLPIPLIVKPAAAQTPPTLYHWHVDHLGSAQVITDSGGAVNEYIRYKPYGTIRGRYNSSGGSVTKKGTTYADQRRR
jgi:YD repeat-containing protein